MLFDVLSLKFRTLLHLSFEVSNDRLAHFPGYLSDFCFIRQFQATDCSMLPSVYHTALKDKKNCDRKIGVPILLQCVNSQADLRRLPGATQDSVDRVRARTACIDHCHFTEICRFLDLPQITPKISAFQLCLGDLIEPSVCGCTTYVVVVLFLYARRVVRKN